MRLATLPGVFKPISDTRLLAECVSAEILPGVSTVLDLCTGSGAVAIAASLAGARAVAAVDVSRRAVWSTRLNALLNHARVEVRRGDLVAPFAERRFDLIAANPPYVPSGDRAAPVRGRARAWEGGPDGRAVIDRICASAPARLEPGGALLLVHSSWCGEAATLEALAGAGLEAEVLARVPGPLGPLMSGRAGAIEGRRLIAPGTREEELLVIGGRATAADDAVQHGVTVPAA